MYPSIPSYPWHSATLVSDKNIAKETNHHHHHCHFHHHRLQIILGPLTMSWVVSSVIITHQPQYTGWEPLCSTHTHTQYTHTATDTCETFWANQGKQRSTAHKQFVTSLGCHPHTTHRGAHHNGERYHFTPHLPHLIPPITQHCTQTHTHTYTHTNTHTHI